MASRRPAAKNERDKAPSPTRKQDPAANTRKAAPKGGTEPGRRATNKMEKTVSQASLKPGAA
jgi:hypothetical protein